MDSLKESKMAYAREEIENGVTDYFVYYHGEQAMIYSDPGGTTVSTEEDTYFFATYDQMLEAPVFWGHRLEEIILEAEITL